MILSSIAMCVGSLLLGAFITYLIMSAENHSDRNEHREAYAEAKVREHNAEAVAQAYVDIKTACTMPLLNMVTSSAASAEGSLNTLRRSIRTMTTPLFAGNA